MVTTAFRMRKLGPAPKPVPEGLPVLHAPLGHVVAADTGARPSTDLLLDQNEDMWPRRRPRSHLLSSAICSRGDALSVSAMLCMALSFPIHTEDGFEKRDRLLPSHLRLDSSCL